MYICVFTWIHMYVYIYIFIHIYMSICVFICTYIYVCTCIHIYIYTHMYAYIHIYINMCMYDICIHIYICVCIYIHICVHTCTCIRSTKCTLIPFCHTFSKNPCALFSYILSFNLSPSLCDPTSLPSLLHTLSGQKGCGTQEGTHEETIVKLASVMNPRVDVRYRHSVLQRVAAFAECCSVLQRIAVVKYHGVCVGLQCRRVLQGVVGCCSVLQLRAFIIARTQHSTENWGGSCSTYGLSFPLSPVLSFTLSGSVSPTVQSKIPSLYECVLKNHESLAALIRFL